MFKRLYSQLKPTSYELTLDINRESLSFTGAVTISGSTDVSQKQIVLHSRHQTIQSVTVDKQTAMFTSGDYDELQIELNSGDDIAPGNHVIDIEYAGIIHDDSMLGVYASNFVHDGKNKQIIVTQFESHYAREALPCIDEPEAKATFTLTLKTPKDEAVLSNMPISEQETVGEQFITTFEQTPRMSTYLLAFGFGELQSVEATTKDGVSVRTWATVAQPKSWLEYSVNEGVRVLEFFTEYFGTPFPLKKCDQLALPDFDAGAMENWGLVTYREIALLSDPDNRSMYTEQYVSLVIAHELSHQWFGNLVTMLWWDDLWLNESFASMMEHLALDALHPDWQQWEIYTSTDVVSTSNRDVYADVQAVRVDVDNPEHIETLFDPAIVYAKGGRLLKMLREYIGDSAFQAGLKQYFKARAYSNTTRDDLWSALSDASGQNIKELMDPWLTQSGMPVVDVEDTPDGLELTQSRFVLDNSEDTAVWPIPLLTDTSIDTDILSSKSSVLDYSGADSIHLNRNGSGHYLVNYTSKAHKQAIAEKLQNNGMGASGRITLFNDALLLAKRGDQSITDVLELAVSNADEERSAVWSLMSMAFGMARSLVEGDDESDLLLRKIYGSLLVDQFEHFGWTNLEADTPNDVQMRVMAASAQTAAERESAVKHALSIYNEYAHNVEALPADMRVVILSAAAQHTTPHEQVVESLFRQYEQTTSADVQLDICSALTRTRTPDDIQLITPHFAPKNMIRPQDMFRWVALLTSNHHVRAAFWDYMEQNWEQIHKVFKSSKAYDYLPVYLGRSLNTQEWKDRYEALFKPYKDNPVLKKNITVTLLDIDSRIAWRARDEDKIKHWLKSK